MVQRLVQGSEDCQDNWSVSELMHAIVLLAHFHSLASFVFGCGVTSETDHPDGHAYAETTDEHNDNATAVNGHTAVTAEVSSIVSVCHVTFSLDVVNLLIFPHPHSDNAHLCGSDENLSSTYSKQENCQIK